MFYDKVDGCGELLYLLQICRYKSCNAKLVSAEFAIRVGVHNSICAKHLGDCRSVDLVVEVCGLGAVLVGVAEDAHGIQARLLEEADQIRELLLRLRDEFGEIEKRIGYRFKDRGLLEVGLAGEVRPAPRGQERLKEAAKLGFTVAVVPKANVPKKNDKAYEGLTIHGVERIEEAMQVVRGLD